MLLELFCKETLSTVVAPAGGGTLQAGLTLESRGCLQDCFLRTWVRLVVVTRSLGDCPWQTLPRQGAGHGLKGHRYQSFGGALRASVLLLLAAAVSGGVEEVGF